MYRLVSTTIGPDYTPQIKQIVLNHYSHNLHYYYRTAITYSFQPNYTILVLYNMLEHPKYHLGMLVPARS